ncbi:MAG: hypothetical protein HDR88_05390 [Bacteroides sp.]|nr:hypothetical protein [Bacteroides sp.]
MTRGIHLSRQFSPSSVIALWVAMARMADITLPEICAIIPEVPGEFPYLSLVTPAVLSPERTDTIKMTIAEAFLPSSDHWYAMKLRRGISFSDISSILSGTIPDAYEAASFFYPERESVKKIGKRIVRETVPVIPDIVFLRIQQRHLADIDRTLRHAGMAWVFRMTNTPDSEYSIIDNASMLTFERAVGLLTPDMKVELTDRAPLSIGREVCITGGVLAGYRGIIYDIKPTTIHQHSDNQPTTRQIYMRISSSDFMKIEVAVDEEFIEPLLSDTKYS